MTYTSLTVKLLTSIVLACSILLLLPAQASSIDAVIPTVEKPKEAVVVTKPVLHVAKKSIKQPLIKGDCTKYADIIQQYDWPEATAMNICAAESSGNPLNINWDDVHRDAKGNIICTSSRGLMQVACFWPASLGYTLADLLDPAKNINMAYQIYEKYGFKPWTTYKGETEAPKPLEVPKVLDIVKSPIN